MSKLYVFRHTESRDNALSLFSGNRNTPLSNQGYKGAEELSESLNGIHIDIAFTSDLLRSVDTMSIVLEHHPGVIVCIDNRIRERSYGFLEGQSKKWWAKYLYPFFKIFHRSYRIPPPGGESLFDVQQRVTEFVEELIDYIERKSLNVAICCHSGSIRGIRQYFEKIPNKEFNDMETNAGQLFIYDVKEKQEKSN
jgi:2,3-bisphosphoglycerate-dependent phosphoglycerate mutase